VRASPQPVRSSFRRRVESVRNPAQIIGEQVPVAVERQRRRFVAHEGLKHLHVGARGDGQAGAGVPEFMRCKPVSANSLRGRVESPAKLPNCQVGAATRRKYQVGVSPLNANGTGPNAATTAA
jgi:hypothetical protein